MLTSLHRPCALNNTSGIDRFAVQPPTGRPHREPVSRNSVWPPVPERALPTPALVRAARALAASAVKQYENNNRQQMVVKPLSALAANSADRAKPPRAQQLQARALAAQAAHQKRMAAGLAVGTEPRRSTSHSGSGFADLGRVSIAAVYPPGDAQMKNETGFSPRKMGSEIPEQLIDIVDELQVDLALRTVATASASPASQHSIPFMSPSAPVDISAFLPPPGPPALIATDETISASAVPLADWAADLCWALVHREVPVGSAGLDWLSTLVEVDARHGAPHVKPPVNLAGLGEFRSFVHATLSATLPSPQCLFIGLYYLSLLPIGRPPLTPPVSLDACSLPDNKFFQTLYRGCDVWQQSHEVPAKVARTALTLALMLGNKWLEDNTFTTRTWHEVTDIRQHELRTVETAALGIFGFSLSVPEAQWLGWLLQLRSYTSILVAREPIGVLKTSNGLTLSRLDNLIRISQAHVQDNMGGGSAFSREKRIFDDGEDTVIFPRTRVRSVVTHPGEVHQHSPPADHYCTTSIPVVPLEFGVDMQLDSPISTGTAEAPYAPIQRPVWDQHRMQFGLRDACAPMIPILRQSDGSRPTAFDRPLYILQQQRGHFPCPPQQFIGGHCLPYVREAGHPWADLDQTQTSVGIHGTRHQAYSWQQVEAEINARSRTLEDPARSWPHPSEMAWVGSAWSRHLTASTAQT